MKINVLRVQVNKNLLKVNLAKLKGGTFDYG